MKQRMYFVLLILSCVMLFSSCGKSSYMTYKSFGNQTNTSWDMSYEKFNGSKAKTVTLKEGQKCDFLINIVSDAGELDFSIVDDQGISYYTGSDIPTSNFTISVDKGGKYEMKFEAKKHKGSFSVSWKISDLS